MKNVGIYSNHLSTGTKHLGTTWQTLGNNCVVPAAVFLANTCELVANRLLPVPNQLPLVPTIDRLEATNPGTVPKPVPKPSPPGQDSDFRGSRPLTPPLNH